MTSSNTRQMRLNAVIVLVAFLGFAFSFNNCGRTPVIEGSDLPNRSMDARLRAVKAANVGQIPAGFCTAASSYECLHKVFSRSVLDEEFTGATQCSLGGALCVLVKSRTYNSAALANECPNCMADYDEYECHVKLPDANGLYPLVITDRTFDGSLSQVRALCDTVKGAL